MSSCDGTGLSLLFHRSLNRCSASMFFGLSNERTFPGRGPHRFGCSRGTAQRTCRRISWGAPRGRHWGRVEWWRRQVVLEVGVVIEVGVGGFSATSMLILRAHSFYHHRRPFLSPLISTTTIRHHSHRSDVAAESYRLNTIVNDTLASLIDVTHDEYSSMDQVRRRRRLTVRDDGW